MQVYIAGTNGGSGRYALMEEDVNIFIAGTTFDSTEHLRDGGVFDQELASRVNLLESFYYVQDWQTRNLRNFKRFMLDSGAYTFVYGSGASVDLDEYTQRYIDYINENDVELFFEMDVDELIGYDKVLELRRRIEKGTNRQCIPVWHINRGKDGWLRMCDEYDYVAIGGIADAGRKQVEPILRWFTSEAHKRGARVHGLGYAKLANLIPSGLDSVDTTTWMQGNRSGVVYEWDGKTLRKHKVAEGQRLKPRDVARHNFAEWVKVAEYYEGIR